MPPPAAPGAGSQQALVERCSEEEIKGALATLARQGLVNFGGKSRSLQLSDRFQANLQVIWQAGAGRGARWVGLLFGR